MQKPQRIQCTHCDLEFDSDVNLKKHENSQHNRSNRMIKCVSCNVESNSEVELQNHMESHQMENKTISSRITSVLDYSCTHTLHFLDYFVVQCVQLYNIKPTKTIVFNHFCVHYNHFIAPKVYSATTETICSN